MSYIGREPQIGNFQVCDAITVVDAQAAYTMQVDTVNVSPESANHMIVSLNGVIQKPTDAYTVSGSTITFAANLVTGDVINFIQILGSVLDLGVPSDATVSTAKIVDANVTAAKMFSGFANGITMADNWRLNADDATDAAETDLDTGWERVDTTGQGTLGSAMTQSSGIFTFPSTGIYLVQFQIWYIMSGGASNARAWIKHFDGSSTYTTLVSVENYQIQDQTTTLYVSTLFDCQATATDKVVFYGGSATDGQVIAGSSAANRTATTFIRLGDT